MPTAVSKQAEGFLQVPTYMVVRPFRFAGRDYSYGHKFNWRRTGCSARRLQQLFKARLIAVPDGETKMREDEPADVEVIDDRITHTGGGWFDVHLEDGRVLRVKGREAAEAALESPPPVEE